MNIELVNLLYILIISSFLSLIILGASLFLNKRNPELHKISIYECGFDPFESSRVPFSVRFFLVGILFMIFDIEISFLYPWAVIYGLIGLQGIILIIIFLIILTIGLIYEWALGGLE